MKNHRVILVFFFVIGLWGAMISRGAYLQLIPNPKFEKIKKRQFSKIVKLSSRRGDILDREGKELAISVTSYSLFADPKIIEDPYMVGKRLSRYFGTSFRHMYKKVKNKKKRFVWIRRKLEKKDYERIKKWKIRGLAFKEEFKRVYPSKTLASHLIGFVGREQQGVDGIEKRYEHALSGDGKKMNVQRDARGRALVEDGRIFAQTSEGSDIHLTLDKDLQYWVEKELAQAVKDHDAESAWAVVLDPKDSAILSMATYPTFDANKALKIKPALRRNKVLNDIYETGSVMKAISIGGALYHGIVEPNTKINTENGVFKIGNRKITEADSKHNFPELTVSEILAHSSNVGTSKIALQMTDKVLYQTLLDFGFAQKTGVGLLGEARGLLSKPPWRDHLTANISFGHGIAVTALQVANAYAAIANGGDLNRPYIIKEIRDVEKGEVIQTEKKTIRRVLDRKNAHLLKMMLTSVVAEGGSGYTARIDGFPVAGKTGTAQKVNPTGRGYLRGHYISSFVGFLPVNDPKYVIYVVVDSPKKKGYYATSVAAPVFRSIARFALRKGGTTPVYMTESDLVLQKKVEEIEDEAVVKSISMNDIKDQPEELEEMPDLKGMTYREVLRKLRGKDIRLTVYGKGKVSKTYPSTGAKLGSNAKVRVNLE
jgi:cell division protein FtsI (penicillin-binding protein 3)